MIEYPKVYGPFKRHTEGPDKNQLIIGEWTKPDFGVLAETQWIWTEKVDGTNIRIKWDGHKVTIGGRTDNAQIPADLVNWIQENVTEELFEQTFGSDEVTLYGEGFGAGIQKVGVNYGAQKTFVLFDVLIGGYWLLREAIKDVAEKMGVAVVPIMLTGTVQDAINYVSAGPKSYWGDFEAEGVVGVPATGLLDRSGRRIQMKVKRADFKAELKAA